MNRSDIQDARDTAERFVAKCDELLETKQRSWDGNQYAEGPWTETWGVSGKLTGAHRRLSLDLTRALAHMRRRT